MHAILAIVLVSVIGGPILAAGRADSLDSVFPDRFSPEKAASWYLTSNGVDLPEVAGQYDVTGGDPVARGTSTAGLAESDPLVRILERTHVSVPLGLFDLRYPRRDLADRKQAATFREIAGALIELQDRWIGWAQGQHPRQGSRGGSRKFRSRSIHDTDAKVLAEWVSSWRLDALSQLEGTILEGKEGVQGDRQGREARGDPPGSVGASDLLALLGAGAPELEAARRFRETMSDASFLGAPPPASQVDASPVDTRPVTLVLAPTREEFLGLAAFVGSLGESQRRLLWVESLPAWTELDWSFPKPSPVGRLLVLALEYARPDWQAGDVARGLSMTAREKTGGLQHVLQHAARSMIDLQLGGTIDPGLATGMEVEIVIDMLGENNARAAGSGMGNATLARSKFVPGYTNGGRLPPINADSRWRTQKGRDYFAAALRRGQSEGEKLAARLRRGPRGRGVHFALQSRTDGRAHCVVTAPFLGPDVADKEIGEECASDYREFFRAYSAAFVYWLRDRSGKKQDFDSAAAFAELLGACHSGGGEAAGTLSRIVESVYGVPLSAPDPSGDSLEWRFLGWLRRR